MYVGRSEGAPLTQGDGAILLWMTETTIAKNIELPGHRRRRFIPAHPSIDTGVCPACVPLQTLTNIVYYGWITIEYGRSEYIFRVFAKWPVETLPLWWQQFQQASTVRQCGHWHCPIIKHLPSLVCPHEHLLLLVSYSFRLLGENGDGLQQKPCKTQTFA